MFKQNLSLRRRKKLLDATHTYTKKSNFPGMEWLAKLISIISAKVQFQGFVQKKQKKKTTNFQRFT